jgi:hypothetical protein
VLRIAHIPQELFWQRFSHKNPEECAIRHEQIREDNERGTHRRLQNRRERRGKHLLVNTLRQGANIARFSKRLGESKRRAWLRLVQHQLLDHRGSILKVSFKPTFKINQIFLFKLTFKRVGKINQEEAKKAKENVDFLNVDEKHFNGYFSSAYSFHLFLPHSVVPLFLPNLSAQREIRNERRHFLVDTANPRSVLQTFHHILSSIRLGFFHLVRSVFA